MLRNILYALIALSIAACSGSKSAKGESAKTSVTSAEESRLAIGRAYFAGGCFWGVEHFLEEIDGVSDVISGFSGGSTENPSYKDVVGGGTGHLEVVEVRFDPKRVSYNDLAKRFFEIHDPTQANGQGPDLGEQYLSAIFHTTDEQKAASEALVKRLQDRGYAVATSIRPFEKFWAAEDYHQDYYDKSGKKPYCHAPVDRFGDM